MNDDEWVTVFQKKAGPRLRKLMDGCGHEMPRLLIEKLEQLREVEEQQARDKE